MARSIPTGTRDVLPDEMRELRAIEATLGELFEERGYGEVTTPTIEYGGEAADSHGYRFSGEGGEALALRSDMTVPIARLVARRFRDEPGPFRLRYSGRVYRPVQPQRGQMRELHQVGIELIGAPSPEGTIEVVSLLVAALEAIGLTRARVGLGDADLFRQLLDELAVAGPARDRILACLEDHDLVAIEAEAGELAGIGEEERRTIVALANLRGGSEVLERARQIGGQAVERAAARLAETYEGLERAGIADRIQLDFGLLRDLGYYTGAIIEVYDPAVGDVLGGGGRYDGVLAGFGREMPAAGFALYLDRLHVAQAAQQAASSEQQAASSGGAGT
jgi:ATP phosphoribosyltransferase regulatory subunit